MIIFHKQGFDKRIVSYEFIHNISQKDVKALIDATDPKPGENILDAMCGYGAAGKDILAREKTVKLFILDESKVQINRARENLNELPKERFVLSKLPLSPFGNGVFEKIIVKMGLHENPKKEQLKIARELYRILKPGGKIVIWDIMLDKRNQALFQSVIREKDKLAGFEMLVSKRYFFREEEFLEIMKKAGFSNIKEFHKINYQFSSKKRLVQELNNKIEKLNELNDFIRKIFPEKLKKQLKYKDFGDDIRFVITKKIYVCWKKS